MKNRFIYLVVVLLELIGLAISILWYYRSHELEAVISIVLIFGSLLSTVGINLYKKSKHRHSEHSSLKVKGHKNIINQDIQNSKIKIK